jgi:hypothetical protein
VTHIKRIAFVAIACASSLAVAGPKDKKKPKPKPPAPEELPAPPPAPEPEPPPPPPPEPKPWSEGVSKDVQDKATALYDEGNQLFGQQAHAPAVEKYKAALALWDHPLIRFNLAVSEIRLERILEAADDLERSLRYGDKPFKPELYQDALNYQSLVKGRVGTIEASCDQAGARLRLDGKPWLSCPGTKKERVLVGEHAIVGEKQGFLTKSDKIVVEGGETETRKVTLVSADSAVILKYRYRRWIPWTTAGMGFGVALAGVGTWFLGKNQMDQFNADYKVQCSNGCEPGLTDPSHRSLASQRDSAEFKGALGIGMMAVGGGVLATGIVLVVLNRPTREMPSVEVAPKSGGGVATVGWHF